MSLITVYQSYLAGAGVLAEDAALHYIPTLTTVKDAGAIAKHTAVQQRLLTKKKESIIGSIESDSALCLDVETTIEFISGGGAYLPGIAENFLTDRIVTFPMIHIVHFSSDRKIQQIRLYWDQGSLLKLVDIIGSRARNWPIKDGKDQARLIASSADSTATGSVTKQMGDVPITSRPASPKKKSVSSATGDPHASLALFAPRNVEEEQSSHGPAAVAPRISAKPPPRDYHDLFVGNDSDASPETQRKIAASPQKQPHRESVSAKGGASAGRNYQPSRLFAVDGPEPGTQVSPQKPPNPKKYSHFDIGDSSQEPAQQPGKGPSSKAQSHWDFEDFNTPHKVAPKIHPQEVRHYGWSDDEFDQEETPVRPAHMAQPRRDAEKHFEMQDDSTPTAEKNEPGHTRGQSMKNAGDGLYTNNLYDETQLESSPEKKPTQPLATMVNVKDRRKDFDPHFEISDSSPGLGEKSASEKNRPVGENRSKAIKMMEAQWEPTGGSPLSRAVLKPAEQENKGITIAGDGMGARKGTATADKENRGIKLGGDGMGGQRGTTRSWGFGEDNEEEAKAPKFQASKKQQGPKGSGFWDF